MQELKEVVDWYHLGLCLEVPDYQLQIIARNHPQDTEMCKTKMLSWWKENIKGQKWSTIVNALVQTGSRVLACKIALKYGSRLYLILSSPPPPLILLSHLLFHNYVHPTCRACSSYMSSY